MTPPMIASASTVRTRTVKTKSGQCSCGERAALSLKYREIGWRTSCNTKGVEKPLVSNEHRQATAEERFKVLVADDQLAITQALELLLRSAGLDVMVANSPAEVMAQIARGHFDLLLMDMNYGR